MSGRDEGRGRIALVTGGASGIGLATAGVLVERGWRVVVADIDAVRCASAAAGIGAEAVPFDVVDEHATAAAIDAIEDRFGPVEALMANAGLIQRGGLAEDLPLAEFDRVVAVNLRGVYVSCMTAGQRMARRGAGGIVITGSVTASRTAPLHAYAPTKAAVVHMAACLAAEWGRSGVRVNAVSPGYVATPPLQAAIDSGKRDPALLTDAAAMGRMVEPREIGLGVAFLLSDDATAITGINLPIDAGWLAGSNLGTYGGCVRRVEARHQGATSLPSTEPSPYDLGGRRVVITGAAGGIGAATARLCVKQGATVVLVDRLEREAIEARVGDLGREGDIHSLDTSDRRAVTALAATVGPVFGLIDCAAICPEDDWMDDDWDDALDRVIAANIKGPLNLARAFFPGMVARKAGRIVLCGSVAGWMGGVRSGPHYAFSKGGMHAFVRWLSRRGAPHGVLVNGIAPGPIDTGMIAGRGYEREAYPLGRMGRPEEIASAAVFLCGAGASYMSGAIMDVNGGVFFH